MLLVSVSEQGVTPICPVEVGEGYDGDPYGDQVSVAVGSNQTLQSIREPVLTHMQEQV